MPAGTTLIGMMPMEVPPAGTMPTHRGCRPSAMAVTRGHGQLPSTHWGAACVGAAVAASWKGVSTGPTMSWQTFTMHGDALGSDKIEDDEKDNLRA
ncbi:hypothetical protein GW17_00006857 [Ensete ventricosum]|nr:hypothetical protein GW17_00006857 [Ensete ventricosum]